MATTGVFGSREPYEYMKRQKICYCKEQTEIINGSEKERQSRGHSRAEFSYGCIQVNAKVIILNVHLRNDKKLQYSEAT